MMGIQQALDQALTFLKGIWIKKRYIIISSWLICPIGWGLVSTMPDQYESSAKVFVDTNSLLRPLLRGLAVYNNPEQQVNLVARTLLSRPNLEKIAREADLDIQAKTQEDLDEVIDELKKNISLSSTREDNIYTISYPSASPELSQKIVQITLNEFVETSLGSNRKSSDSAEEFLNRQIKEYEQRLLEAEQRLAEFKRNRMDKAPGDTGDYYSKLQSQKGALQEAQLRLKELNSQLVSARAQLAGEEPVFGLATPSPELDTNPNISTQYDGRIASLEQRLDDLLIKYTDQHPDVVKIQGLIKSLKAERKKQLDAMKDVADKTGSYSQFGNLNQNPVYQEMKMNVANLESEIASIEVRVKTYKDNVKSLEEKINLIPVIEAEFQGLNRDYGIIKSKYLELLSRKDSAELSRKAEATSDDIQFRVIEPPRLPTKPSGPKRIIFYVLVLFVGFGSGLGIAFIVSQINPVVFSHYQLTQHFKIPILGAVSHVELAKIARVNRRRVIIFSLSTTVLLVMFAGIIGVELIYGKLPLHLLERFI
ncbi:XrtA system polysaccharide chain length determinant [Neptunicella marina]|uniref:Lipopolysaccharide biosynthesis n=1 Tax=Neptunicella marina TaxID=2125989 RepID=A0A8J6ITQ5_9ALTE|nr:XrtA system polysaccharide chain length determinant [Neptunicella marina]MBC3765752.1 lipopolysaccharide biosynthesis [Neptunicella marina]